MTPARDWRPEYEYSRPPPSGLPGTVTPCWSYPADGRGARRLKMRRPSPHFRVPRRQTSKEEFPTRTRRTGDVARSVMHREPMMTSSGNN